MTTGSFAQDSIRRHPRRAVLMAIVSAGAMCATLLGPRLVSADTISARFSCSCMKKNEKIKHACPGGALTVTVKTSSGSEDGGAEAAASKCQTEYRAACPRHSCTASASKMGETGSGSSGESEDQKVTEKTTGIADEHAEGLAKYADENDVTIIVRTTNPKSLPYHDKDKSEYRPKPLTLSALKTEQCGKNAGLIVKPDWRGLIAQEDPTKSQQQVDDEIAKLKRDCKRVKSEDRNRSFCGWYTDNHGVVRDENKRAVFGDYDLQGVYKDKQLLDTNDSKEGKALRLELNQAIDPSRQSRDDWMIQHGGNDNYKKKGKMGRQSGMDEDFVIFDPDGQQIYIEDLPALQKYYQDHGFPWPYLCPDDSSCKKQNPEIKRCS